MVTGLKVLIVDDEKDLLDFYGELLRNLPSRPEVHTATTGARALALLEAEPFSLLITDLNMPRMDGFQILMLVRRKFPGLRTAVITGMTDQEYRARAYAIGIDLYIEKPQTKQEMGVFTDCIEALLDRVEHGGFRGVQSKSLLDLVQMECLSQGESVLKIVNGVREGRIWISAGDIIDARLEDLRGEEAFRQILSWRTGSFEILAPEPKHERTIQASGQSLLLEAAQWLDETTAADTEPGGGERGDDVLRAIGRMEGVESVLSFSMAANGGSRSWGVDDAEKLRRWAGPLMTRLEKLSEQLCAGPLRNAVAAGPDHHFALQSRGSQVLLLGLRPGVPPATGAEIIQRATGDWDT